MNSCDHVALSTLSLSLIPYSSLDALSYSALVSALAPAPLRRYEHDPQKEITSCSMLYLGLATIAMIVAITSKATVTMLFGCKYDYYNYL